MKVCEICGARFRGDPAACPLDGGTLVPVPDPLVGRTLAGRYVIEERIGVGGMATVYRAKHEVVGRDVAIKFLSPDLAYEPTNKTRFLREAKAANRINHEHIIDITDFGETDDGLVYLVMEHLDGVPLGEEIRRGALPLARTMQIVYQVSRALARAHELDVVHRDIKPDNIFLLRGYDGDFVKLLDFGLAHMKGELRVTATGTVFGTPEYMSPEQARGAPITPAADLYSLGVVFFEMLTGQLPFSGSTTDLILKHLREPARAPSFHQRHVPADIDALVLRLLEKSAEDRPPSAHALAEELKAWLERHRDSKAPPVEAPPAPRRVSKTTERDHPSVTELVTRWLDRVEVFRGLVPRAHPDGPPSWLLAALAALDAEVKRLARLRDQLVDRITVVTTQEDEAREARMRIGRALDALGYDLARVERELAGLDGRLAEARARAQQVGEPLLRAWRKVPRYATGAPLEPDVVAALAEAGALARIRLEAERAQEDLEKDRGRLEAERDDLTFQIEQLKGRFGGMSAVREVDLDEVKRETSDVDKQLQARLDAVVKEAEPIVRHFMAFPRLRDIVRGAHGGVSSSAG